MKKYTNFYETIKEANMRLQHTVITYDGDPYYVLCITDHKSDGIFRMYLNPVGNPSMAWAGAPYEWHEEAIVGTPATLMDPPKYIYHKVKGEKMDEWLEANPTSGILRKMMNSPAFNKFRPFEIGMINMKHGAVYAQRSPTRHTQQGLTSSMVSALPVSLNDSDPRKTRGVSVELTSEYFLNCIKGIYPDAKECIKELKDKTTTVDSAAFHRNFAFVRGPVSSLFLVYKEEVIGIVPGNTPDQVLLGSDYKHCKEVVESLGVFSTVTV